MDYEAILADAASWVNRYIEKQNNSMLCFHDARHTAQVVAAARQIATQYTVSEHDYFVVVIAAYFHDLGYFTGPAEGHEERGAEIAGDFLRERGVDQETVEQVERCILATRVPHAPQNLLEEILCDADFFHFGSDDFAERNRLIRREASDCAGKRISKKDWRKNTIALMENHRYHTDYAQRLLSEKKQRNLEAIRKNAEAVGDTDYRKKSDERPDRGIETLFRVTSTNNQRLSDMADNKANILITVNSIILSVIIALLLRRLDESERLMIPTFFFAGSEPEYHRVCHFSYEAGYSERKAGAEVINE